MSHTRIEFGDFQTPQTLADAVCRQLFDQGCRPASVIEPTCGAGAFLVAAAHRFPSLQSVVGVDRNVDYVAEAKQRIRGCRGQTRIDIRQGDFFEMDWRSVLANLAEPILILGNPPWVTNSRQSVIGGDNLPPKRNDAGLSGIEAITGKGNFDIAEWMIRELLAALDGKDATLAMLCKTSVARKVLVQRWKDGDPAGRCSLHQIDARRHFNAAVDACLLTVALGESRGTCCDVYDRLEDATLQHTFGLVGNQLVADVDSFREWQHLTGQPACRWRSGIKHDCARVMELRSDCDTLRNGFGEVVEIEDDCLYPMLKGSELAKLSQAHSRSDRWMLVPQREVGDDTAALRTSAPRTWDYLVSHADRLDRRASSIYRNRSRFSVFGVGAYTFAPWKVAIASLYKRLNFRKVGPRDGRPVVFDDTCYFVACQSEQEADELLELLSSEPAQAFYSSLIFWDAKRPITCDVLNKLDTNDASTALRPV